LLFVFFHKCCACLFINAKNLWSPFGFYPFGFYPFGFYPFGLYPFGFYPFGFYPSGVEGEKAQ
jgi:hypothetical protein